MITLSRCVSIDLGDCTGCEGCIEICPEAFRLNEITGKVEVSQSESCPEDLIEQVMSLCPGQCIHWEE
jgi:ferredoxin